MIRNLKALGLALVAAFAMSGVAASAASADSFTTEKAPVNVTGTTDPGTTESVVTTAGSVTCHGVYIGTVSNVSTTTIEVAPTYNNCTALGFPGSVVHVNNCKYVFHINSAAGVTTGTVDIVCPAGEELTVTALSAGTLKCTIHIGTQTDLSSVTYTSVGSGTTREVTVNVLITNLKYKHTSAGATGLGKCTKGSATNGTYSGKAIVTAREDPGSNHVGIFLS